MIHIPYNKADYYLPENFNELTGDQVVRIAKLLRQENDNAAHELQLLHELLDINMFSFFRIPLDAKAAMLTLIDWVFGDNTLTKQLLPEYKGFFGPKSEFDNLTLGEFHCSETYYHGMAAGDQAALNNLVAVLYRVPAENYDIEKDSAGDIRITFNTNELAFYAKKIASWPIEVKTAIVMWYDGCRQNLVQLYDEVFSAPGAPDHTQEETGMYSMIRNLSGDKFGKIKEVESVYVHNAFFEIEQVMEDNRRQDAALKTRT
ncbi:MAG: hypothetical protein ABI921_12465 [Panacibacter sp.]